MRDKLLELLIKKITILTPFLLNQFMLTKNIKIKKSVYIKIKHNLQFSQFMD